MYEIVIKKKEITRKPKGRKWEVLEERPFTPDEITEYIKEHHTYS